LHWSAGEIEDHIAALQPSVFGRTAPQDIPDEHPSILGDLELARQL
jgi:hypothetical protein